MIELYQTTPAPVKKSEVVEAVYGILNASLTKPASVTVYKHRRPDGASGEVLVVREPVFLSGLQEGVSRTKGITVDVMFEVSDGIATDPYDYLSDAHAWAFSVLVGQTISVATGDSFVPISRETEPSAVAYDADDHAWYSTATYLVAVKP